MAEDFMLEEEEESSGSPNRRNFLIIASILGLIFIAAMICNVTLLNQSDNSNFVAESATIVSQNATIAVQNAADEATWTAEAIQAAIDATNEAQPEETETVELIPTNTGEPKETPTPTNTAVVKVNETATPNLSGTSQFEATEDGTSQDETPDAIVGDNSSSSPSTATPVPSSDDGEDALPDTGINSWATIIIGLILVAVLIGARRIRQA